MELDEAMRTQHACRYYRDDPVPDEVLYRAVELARFAPNGGNRGAVRFVFVRDERLRARLGEWYLPLLGIPGHMSTACHIVAGYPARPFPRRLHRPDVSQIAFGDRFGDPLG